MDLELFKIAVEAMRDSIAITAADKCEVIYINSAFEKQTGYSQTEVLGKNLRFLQGDDHDQESLVILHDAIEGGQSCEVLLRNYRKDGTLFYNELSVSPIKNTAGEVTHFVGVQNDVSRRINAEQKLQIMASRDFLTQTYNRHYFTEQFEQEFQRAKRHKTDLTLILCDVDNFKIVNDVYGHLQGDVCLQKVAERLQAYFKRTTDIIARYGGDEFILALPATTADQAYRLTEKFRQDLSQDPIYSDLEDKHA
nr:diguanylate cyclase [Gammaproteobacteria bacterium]